MKYILRQKISEHLYDAKEYYDRLNKHFRTIGHDRRVGTYDETKVVVKNAYRVFWCNALNQKSATNKFIKILKKNKIDFEIDFYKDCITGKKDKTNKFITHKVGASRSDFSLGDVNPNQEYEYAVQTPEGNKTFMDEKSFRKFMKQEHGEIQ